MILIVAIIAGIGVALLRGGSLKRLSDLPLRLGWVAIAALLAQAYGIYAPADRLDSDRTLHVALIMGSYAALLAVVWANRGLAGMRILAVGLMLNLAVMAANGGLMPVSREAVLAAGVSTAETVPAEGARLPRSKDVLLSIERTRLGILSDVIVLPPPVARVCSLGDIVIGLGAFLLLQAAMASNRGAGLKEDAEAQAA